MHDFKLRHVANKSGRNINLALEHSASERRSLIDWKIVSWGCEFKMEAQGRLKSILSKDQLRATVKANLQTTTQVLTTDSFCYDSGKCKNGPESILLKDDTEWRRLEVYSLRFSRNSVLGWNMTCDQKKKKGYRGNWQSFIQWLGVEASKLASSP